MTQQRPQKINLVNMAIVAAIIVVVAIGVWTVVDSSPWQPTVLENYFLDIDGDGDLDYVIRAEVMLNCANKLCEPPKEAKE